MNEKIIKPHIPKHANGRPTSPPNTGSAVKIPWTQSEMRSNLLAIHKIAETTRIATLREAADLVRSCHNGVIYDNEKSLKLRALADELEKSCV